VNDWWAASIVQIIQALCSFKHNLYTCSPVQDFNSSIFTFIVPEEQNCVNNLHMSSSANFWKYEIHPGFLFWFSLLYARNKTNPLTTKIYALAEVIQQKEIRCHQDIHNQWILKGTMVDGRVRCDTSCWHSQVILSRTWIARVIPQSSYLGTKSVSMLSN